MKTRIEIRTDNLSGVAPLYRRGGGDCTPWRAYVELDCERACVGVYSYPNDHSTPGEVWHGLVQQYAVSPWIQRQALIDLMESDELQTLARRVLAGYSSELNNQSNLVGTLDDDARDADEAMGDLVRDWGTEDNYCRVESASEILTPKPDPRRVETATCRISYEHDLTRETTDADLREWADALESECEAQNCIVEGDLYEELVEMRDALTQDKDDGGDAVKVSYDSDAAMATARSGRIWTCCEALETTGEPVWSYSSLRDEGDPIMDDLREAALEEMRDHWDFDGSLWSRPHEL